MGYYQNQIARISDDQLTTEIWAFSYSYDSHVLRLDEYKRLIRPSRRHRTYNLTDHYDRFGRTGSKSATFRAPLPDDVVAEARQHFLDHMATVRIGQEQR